MVTLSCRETEQHCRFLQLGSVTFYIIGTFSYLQDVTVLFLLAMQTQIEKNPTHPEDVVIPQWLWSSKAPCKRQISIRRHRKELHLSINIDLNTTSEYRQQHSLLSIQLCNFHLCNQYLPLIQSWFVVAACWGGCSSHPSPLQLLPVPYEILRYSQAKPPWLAPCNTEEQQPYSNVSL